MFVDEDHSPHLGRPMHQFGGLAKLGTKDLQREVLDDHADAKRQDHARQMNIDPGPDTQASHKYQLDQQANAKPHKRRHWQVEPGPKAEGPRPAPTVV